MEWYVGQSHDYYTVGMPRWHACVMIRDKVTHDHAFVIVSMPFPTSCDSEPQYRVWSLTSEPFSQT